VPTWLIIVLAVLLLLAVGGMIARALRQRRGETLFLAKLEQANHDLAEAAAADRGWDRSVLEGAARRFYAEQRGAEPAELLLVEVIDRPGTDDDIAVFQADAEGRRETLTLGRHDGEWGLESLE
jgi:hypothetical protein